MISHSDLSISLINPTTLHLKVSGWNAAELIVEDVDGLAVQLENSPFKIIGSPADLSFTKNIRAMQVMGPANEILYLTQFKNNRPRI